MEDIRSAALAGSGSVGPTAPQDAEAKRSEFYIIYDMDIEAAARGNGTNSQEFYLEGEQLINMARIAGGVTDDAILTLLRDCAGIRKLVHSIGVSVKAGKDTSASSVTFVLENWGKTSKYETGTRLRVPCPVDGSETVVILDEVAWSSDDDVPGKIAFEFQHAGALATASVILYLHEPYEVQEMLPESPVEVDSEAYQAMIAKSLMSPGNNKRLKAAIEKTKRGEAVTIAYIGGSITHGAGAKPLHTDCYAYKSYLAFKQMFGKPDQDHIRFIKAGVGGTPSELGVVRYNRDVLRDGSAEPDIVIVEFAVNDAGDETKGNCYESLCLKILSAANKPAVVLLFSVFVNDWNLQDRLAPIGWHYGLPMVSVKDAVVDQFRLNKEEGHVISKRQFFYDIYHPTNAGHTVMADCLRHLFAVTDQAEEDREDITLDQPPLIGSDFARMRLLDRANYAGMASIQAGSFTGTDTDLQLAEMDDHPFGTPQFPNNWMHAGESGHGSFAMTITSRNLILVFKDSGRADFGSAEIWVDGRMAKLADPHEVNWTHCNAVLLYQEETPREHHVEIRMAPGHEHQKFTILGFGYTM
ncbi:SGNH/GDSL hydrolase family protein [Paenibacillus aurantiacus]|uniref:SGNH/GDSL hydrolase family protein n=1 Tax=Paenibacillus aurantiacus TaxID=1936118 RepID=A0ABV5KS97_9BACL